MPPIQKISSLNIQEKENFKFIVDFLDEVHEKYQCISANERVLNKNKKIIGRIFKKIQKNNKYGIKKFK